MVGIFLTKKMEANYNFIFTEILMNIEDKKFLNDLIEEMQQKRIRLDIKILGVEAFETYTYSELKKLLDSCLEANHQKIKCIKSQDFNGASLHRETERELHGQIEKLGFTLFTAVPNGYALYHLGIDRKNRIFNILLFTNSNECFELCEWIKR